MSFNPIGTHSAGLAISTAQTIAVPAELDDKLASRRLLGSAKLLMQALGQNVRFTLDGTTPTATTGFQLRAGDPPLIIPIQAGATVKVIEEAATATLQFQWGN